MINSLSVIDQSLLITGSIVIITAQKECIALRNCQIQKEYCITATREYLLWVLHSFKSLRSSRSSSPQQPSLPVLRNGVQTEAMLLLHREQRSQANDVCSSVDPRNGRSILAVLFRLHVADAILGSPLTLSDSDHIVFECPFLQCLKQLQYTRFSTFRFH